MVNESKLDRSDLVILMITVFCLLYAGYLYYHDDQLKISKRGITPVIDDDTHFLVNFKMNSTVFSAQNDLTITTTAWPLDKFLEKHKNDEFARIDIIYIYFLGASTKFDEITDNGVMGPTLAMKKGTDGRFHGGPYTIQYQESGEKCVVVSIRQLPVVPHYCKKDQQPLLEITSADSILQYKNNKVILSLTWVVIAFTVLTIRDPLRGIFRKYFDNNNYKGNNKKSDA